MSKGYLALVLHAHLPYVRHPELESSPEERRLFAAITETYLPLLNRLERLIADGARFQITWSLSPTLIAMLEDPLLRERYRRHLGASIALAQAEESQQRDGHLRWLAASYRRGFEDALAAFDACEGRLTRRFKRLHEAGAVELITSAATHAILPLLHPRGPAAMAQIATGLDYFESVFGFRPRGLWLPECAWSPGLDSVLRRHGIRYFFVQEHGIVHASVTPFHGVHAPLFTPSGVAAFGHDRESTKEVWSLHDGFAGDADYREPSRDIGYDYDAQYIRQFLGGSGRAETGIKYHRITGPTSNKQPYQPEVARERAARDAGIFLTKRIAHVDYLNSALDGPPIVTALFEASLFGQAWHEGPQWLDYVIRKAVYDQDTLELVSISEYLARHPVHQVAEPGLSSLGADGYLDQWLNRRTDWIQDTLIDCGMRMQRLADRATGGGGADGALVTRALNQALRELLLAQASDWPTLIVAGQSVAYAERRFKDHVSRFHHLAHAVETGTLDPEIVAALEYMDNLFPAADFRAFRDPGAPEWEAPPLPTGRRRSAATIPFA